MKKPELIETRMVFTQDGDSRNEALQIIDIETVDDGAGAYYIIRTDRWAFDNIDELIELLGRVPDKSLCR